MAEKDEKKRIMITLSKDIFEEIEKISKKTGLSKSALITLWVNEHKKA
ncbi:ribbon-helix-helix protein, CopG family [Macrococcus brunensis]|nr:ribbon-helix-helix protein, CopG family [Macrococcus brunensis]ULG73168.1 ribbon-helix-helix protein, CopG family [Macrococcus brunensis]